MNPREINKDRQPISGGGQTIDSGGVCSMNTFFKSYVQSFLALITLTFFLSVVVSIVLVATPYYKNWYAQKAVERAELVGMAELARMSQLAQINVEMAQTERVALGLRATGFKSAAKSQADAIRIIADAVKRYPDNINDEYLNLMFKNTLLEKEED